MELQAKLTRDCILLIGSIHDFDRYISNRELFYMKQSSFPNHTVTILITTHLQKSLGPASGKKAYAKHGAKHSLCFNSICNLISASVSGIQIEALLKRALCIWECRDLPLESNGLTGTILLRCGFLGVVVWVLLLYIIQNCICYL